MTPRMGRFARVRWIPAMALSLALLAGCEPSGGRVAGTSHETETGNSIAGTIRTGDGAAAAGLTVYLRTARYALPVIDLSKRARIGEWADSAVTDAAGRFRFDLRADDSGSFVVEAMRDTLLGVRAPVALPAPGDTDLGDLVLLPAGHLRGRLFRAGDEPGALIQLFATSRYRILDSGTAVFDFGPLPAGTYAGRAMRYRPAGPSAEFTVVVAPGNATDTLAVLLPEAGAVLQGRVLLPPGTRGTAEVEAVGTGIRARADSAGRYMLAGLPQGMITLRAYGLRPARDTIKAKIEARTGTVAAVPDLSLLRLSLLLVDGVNNHDWPRLTRTYQAALGAAAGFRIEVATTPPYGSDSAAWSSWAPDFGAFDAVLLNYTDITDKRGAGWPAAAKDSLRGFVAGGGGMIVPQSSQSAFATWGAYRDMLGLAWAWATDTYPGFYIDSSGVPRASPAGSESSYTVTGSFLVRTESKNHPLSKGMPATWLHAGDAVDLGLRGPAQNLSVVASIADPATGLREPVAWTVAYGKGRVFSTSLGDLVANGPETGVRCAGFQSLLARGAEWACTGTVTHKLPSDFPGPDSTVLRDSIP